MVKTDNNTYDAVIIGAGIGGLVCGCYLAKAGMKVLIAEQHHKPGGYCTSFKRNGFTFDAAPHCFGSYRQDGIMRKILSELAVDKKLTVIRPDPSDIIITPDFKIRFWNELGETVRELQESFPVESSKIKDFIDLLLGRGEPNAFPRMRNLTFKQLLDHYLTNDKLKAILSIPFFGVGGLPSSLMSAYVGAKLFSEFLLDGGYYPRGGMQTLSDALAMRFAEFGGELRLSSRVKKIRTNNSKVTGVVVENSDVIPTRNVISNCDARQTFSQLLGKDKIEEEFYNQLHRMVPSVSNYILYLGMNEQYVPPFNPGTFVYFFPHYDLEKAFLAAQHGDTEGDSGFALRISHDKSTINAIMLAPFKNKTYWMNNKDRFLTSFLERIEKCAIPNVSQHILFKEAATPQTLYRYTLNYKGASFGWAGIPSQLAISEFNKPSFIQGLYLTGHWTTLGVGISGTAYVGYGTAKMVLRKEQS